MNRDRFKSIGNLYICIILFLLIIIVGFYFMEKNKNKPIIIGFSGQLTGRQAELGVQERNGVQLAVEKINADGGIKGRKISLIVYDDIGKPEEAKSGDIELIKKKAIAIIGHSTASQTLAGLKVTNPNHVVMIGPTVSTPELSGLDDYFFRVYPSFKNSSKNFAQYAYKFDGVTHMSIIYDNDNSTYSKTYSKVFAREFKALGGHVTDEVSFSSVKHPDFFTLLKKLQKSKADGLLIVASDIDTAFIAQRARLMEWQIPMFTSAWAQTETLINNGGKAVEGMKIEQAYTLANKSKAFVDFQSCYKARFGKTPSFGAAFSYETMLMLSEALKKTNGNKDGLKQALLQIRNFNGLMNTFSFDKFGDVERPGYLSTIHNRKFIIVNNLTSSNSGGSK